MKTETTKIEVPLLDINRQIKTIRKEIDSAIAGVIDGAKFILGPEVSQFEKNVAEYCGVKYAVGCASGSDAILLALHAVGVKPGDTVITTAYSFYATAGSIWRLGAQPV
ncbi:DegT/DnrJ/EryC1/StrS family aminotransferase, partial [bacterium]|nr:DegT/DnrJ/EryC1/StrS family aminotransferase [bacterium]